MDEIVETWFTDRFHGSALGHVTEHYNVVRRAADALKPLLAAAPSTGSGREAVVDRWYRDSFPGSQVDTRPEHIALVMAAVSDLKLRLAALSQEG